MLYFITFFLGVGAGITLAAPKPTKAIDFYQQWINIVHRTIEEAVDQIELQMCSNLIIWFDKNFKKSDPDFYYIINEMWDHLDDKYRKMMNPNEDLSELTIDQLIN